MISRRPVAAFLLGLLAIAGVPIVRIVVGESFPEIWVQLPAAAGAIYLLWRELREQPSDRRWRILAGVGGALALAWLGGVLFLWLIWPT